MKVAAIIAEYNPFHNGHKYQIEQIKKSYDAVIVIMSSSFTQRGIPAIIDKFTRAEIAISEGADIVLELPVIFSSSNAEIFSKGAIGILKNIDFINALYFGTEDPLDKILNISEKIKNSRDIIDKKIREYLSSGNSFLTAREKSLDFLNEDEKLILKKPNNILAFEYIKALDFYNSDIEPKNIIRYKSNHNSHKSSENYSSGSNIRFLALNERLDICCDFMPYLSSLALKNKKLNFYNNYFNIFKFKVLENKINYYEYFDFEKGLDDRFKKYLFHNNIDDFISDVSTKRYTKSRISRLINNIILDIKKDFVLSSMGVQYFRVLALSETGGKLIKNDNRFIRKFSKIFNEYDEKIKLIAEKEIFATNLYNMYTNNIYNEDYIKSPYYKKELRD